MSDHVVCVDHFKVAEGKLEDLKSYASEMSETVANKLPGGLSFNYFIDERGENGTAVFVFENTDALDTHLQVNAERFQEAMPLVAETSIELMGPASETANQLTVAVRLQPQDEARRFRPLVWDVLQALVR